MLEHGAFMLKHYTVPRVLDCCVPTTAILGREGQRENSSIVKRVYLDGRKEKGGEEWALERYHSTQASWKLWKGKLKGLFKSLLQASRTPKN